VTVYYFQTTLKLLWDKLREGGFSSFRRAMSIALDPDGEENAYRVSLLFVLIPVPIDNEFALLLQA